MKYMILVTVIVVVLLGISINSFVPSTSECARLPHATINHQGRDLRLYYARINGVERAFALTRTTRTASYMADPKHLNKEFRFKGNWRTLRPIYASSLDQFLCDLRFSWLPRK
jgi:hypothetical protein